MRLDGGAVLAGDEELGTGHVLGEDEIERRMEEARAGIGTELQRFAENTLEYVQREADLVFAPVDPPEAAHRPSPAATRSSWCGATTTSRTSACCGRTSASSSRCSSASTAAPTPSSRWGSRPTSSSATSTPCPARAMEVGAEHVHHVHPDGRNPGFDELQAFGKPYDEFVVEGTSEDAAMLLAYEAGAKLIVAVGTHDTMVEFLDKGRAGMSSTFLTRLRIGPMLVDAKGVARLYEPTVRRRDLVFLVLAAAPRDARDRRSCRSPLRVYLDGIWLTLRDLWFSITDRF